MLLKQTGVPAVEPISLAEANLHLKVESTVTADDTLITELIKTSRRVAESFVGEVLITQTWEYYLDKFPSKSWLYIPLPPLQSITSIVYTDKDSVAATFAASKYQVDTISKPGRVLLKDGQAWPTDNLQPALGVKITFIAGYGATSAAVPENIRSAILVILGFLYENRGESAPDILPKTAELLLWQGRVVPNYEVT